MDERPKSVLIVGDPALSRSLMQLVLNKLEYAVCCVATAEEARRAVRRQRFSFVLLALNLPDGSGLELGGEFRRAVPELRDVPIVLFGDAWDEERTRAACRELGLQGYLAKPLPIGRLLGLVRELTQRSGAAGLRGAAMEEREPAVDAARLDAVTDGDRQLARELGSLYLTTAERYCAELERATEPAEVSRIAHALKGASRNLGITAVARLAERIEKAGSCEDVLGELRGRLEQVREYFGRLETSRQECLDGS